jgi:hypothetical protein
LFKRNGTIWEQPLLFGASDKESNEGFGVSVGLSNNQVVVGVPGDGSGGVNIFGSAYVFGLASLAEIYCTAGVSASGCQASIGHLGEPSASAVSGFDLLTSGVEGSKDGLFFFGTNGQQANPWGNGTSYQCVVPPVKRCGLLAGTGTVGACDGSFAQDLNATWCSTCPYPQKNPGAGAVVQAQLWYRDPLSTSNQTTSLSDAIEFVVSP